MEVHFIDDRTGQPIVGYSKYKGELPRISENVRHNEQTYLVIGIVHTLGVDVSCKIICRRIS